MNRTDVIVGVDGSPGGTAALRWAAGEAALRDVPLRVVVAYEWRWPGRPRSAASVERTARHKTETLLERAVAEARSAVPDLTVTGAVVRGLPARSLIEAANAAALVVVGSRGHHSITTGLLGSTAQQVTHHAPTPVVVVRGYADQSEGTVLVGVDGSGADELSLRTAFEEATLRWCGITVVRAFMPPAAQWLAELPVQHDMRATMRELHGEVEAAVAPWREKYPQVPVECQVVQGDAPRVLTDRSRTARLVVAGSRGHGGFAGLLLGSVSMYLAHHAACPLFIARDVTVR